jgi:hypothetical protein
MSSSKSEHEFKKAKIGKNMKATTKKKEGRPSHKGMK